MKKLGEVFEEYGLTLFDQDKTDLIESYADMTISELCGLEDVLKDIPVCSIYQKYLNRECSWEMFEEVSLILERFFYQDAEQLKALYRSHIKLQKKQENSVIATMSENNHCDRLVALGLVWQKYTAVLNGGINMEYCLTDAGLILAGAL